MISERFPLSLRNQVSHVRSIRLDALGLWVNDANLNLRVVLLREIFEDAFARFFKEFRELSCLDSLGLIAVCTANENFTVCVGFIVPLFCS